MLRASMRSQSLLALATALSLSGCYRVHSNGEGGVIDASARDTASVVDDAPFDAPPDTGILMGDCRLDSDCPAPIASCARAVCLEVSCGVVEIPGACPVDSTCDLSRGCVPNLRDAGLDTGPVFDAGAPDADRADVGMRDAATFDADFPDTGPIDAFVPDAFVGDSGPPPTSSAIRCRPDTVLRVPNHAQLNFGPTATLELWVRARGPGTIAIKGTAGGSHIFSLRIEGAGDAATIVGGWGNGSAERLISAPFGDRMGRWAHVALVQSDLGDTVALSLLLDGVVVSTATVPDDFVAASNSLDLLMCSFDGDLDEIRLWRVVRDATSIVADLRRSLPSGIVGLSAYWPLEGRGQIVLDRSLHGADGVLGDTFEIEVVDPMRIPDGAF